MNGGSSLSHRGYTFFIAIVFYTMRIARWATTSQTATDRKYQAATEVLVSKVWKKNLIHSFSIWLSGFCQEDFAKKCQQHWFPKPFRVTGLKTTQQSPHYTDTIFNRQIRRQQLKRRWARRRGQGNLLHCKHIIRKSNSAVSTGFEVTSEEGAAAQATTRHKRKNAQNHLWRHLTPIRAAENWSYGSLKRKHGDIWPIRAERGNVLLHSQPFVGKN